MAMSMSPLTYCAAVAGLKRPDASNWPGSIPGVGLEGKPLARSPSQRLRLSLGRPVGGVVRLAHFRLAIPAIGCAAHQMVGARFAVDSGLLAPVHHRRPDPLPALSALDPWSAPSLDDGSTRCVASAWATLIVYFTMTLVSYFLGRKYYPVPYPIGRIVASLMYAKPSPSIAERSIKPVPISTPPL